MTLLLMVLIGSGFMVGLMSSSTMLKKSVDAYDDANELMDFQIYSSFGFCKEDLEVITNTPMVDKVEGSKFVDAYGSVNDSTRFVVRVQELESELNRFELKEGRMPEKFTEALVLEGSELSGQVAIGDVIEVYSDDDISDSLKYTKFKIVGKVSSPLYLAKTNETSTFKNLTLDTVIYVQNNIFIADYYTTVYLTVDGAKEAVSYSDEYDKIIAEATPYIEDMAKKQQDYLKDDLIKEANEEIADAQATLEREVADAQKEIADGQKELDDAYQELLDGEEQLADGIKEYQDGIVELEDAKKELDDAQKQLDEGKAELEDGRRQLAEGQAELQAGIDQIQEQFGMSPSEAKSMLNDAQTAINEVSEDLDIFDDIINLKMNDDLNNNDIPDSDEILGYDDETEHHYGFLESMQKEEVTEDAFNDYKNQITAIINNEIALNQTIVKKRGNRLLKNIQTLSVLMGMFGDESDTGSSLGQLTSLAGSLEPMIEESDNNLQTLSAIQENIAGLNYGEVDEQAESYTSLRTDISAYYSKTKLVLDNIPESFGVMSFEQLAGILPEGELKQTVLMLAQIIPDVTLNEFIDDPSGALGGPKENIRAELAAYSQELAAYEGLLDELLDGQAQLADARRQLKDAEKQIEDGQKEIDDGWVQYYDGQKELEDGKKELEDARVELDDGWVQYYDGIAELEDGKRELEDEVNEAKNDIAKAKQDLEDLPEAEWTVLDRESNYSQALFGGTVDQMANIGYIFPLLFFLVAALVCLTTMTRLIDEERGQMGIFSALGFSNNKIISKYLIYALLASLLGALLGIPIGMAIYPTIIYNTWKLMYNLPTMIISSEVYIVVLGIVAFASLMMLVTYYVARKTLKDKPAELMRPKAPKVGKKIFLERIDPLWKRLSFITKINARNIFRYKARFLMTVIGVAGCTSLLVLGFGIKDAIADIIDIQYGEIFNYDETITLEDLRDTENILEELKADSKVSEAVEFIEYSSKVYIEDEPVITIEVFNVEDIDKVIDLRERKSGKELSIGDGAIISEKFATANNIGVGDVITIESANGIRKDIEVAGICELYFQHYLFMSAQEYTALFDERVDFDKIALISDDTEYISSAYGEFAGVESITDFSGVVDNFQTMIGALNFIIIVIILAAGSLALVVLINLTEVNISERIREIATFKVLGFYDREVNAYIFKEIIFLTLLGALCGMPLGKLEHKMVMQIIDMDMIMYGENIAIPSYVYSVFITLGFTIVVLIVMSRSLKRVKMVESLKSVE